MVICAAAMDTLLIPYFANPARKRFWENECQSNTTVRPIYFIAECLNARRIRRGEMSRFKPIIRNCSRCGKKGDTTDIPSRIMFTVDSDIVSTVHMKKWKDYCDDCGKEISSKLSELLKTFDDA